LVVAIDRCSDYDWRFARFTPATTFLRRINSLIGTVTRRRDALHVQRKLHFLDVED
jgi:hypothetical protein